MGINLSKTTHVIFFAGVIPAISVFLAWGFAKLFPTLPFWVENLSPLLAYGLLYSWFEKSLWRLGIFRFFGIVTAPDLQGRWKGYQQSSYKENGENKKVDAFLEVVQTFSKICVCAYYQRSTSESVSANFTEINGKNYLFYTYDSDPNSMKEGTMEAHKGTAKLQYLNDKKLIGFYFNSIGNRGEMNFDFESPKLLCRFAE